MRIRSKLLLYIIPLIGISLLPLGYFAYRTLVEGFQEQVRLEGAQLCQMAAGRIEQKLDECYSNMLVLQSEATKELSADGALHFQEHLLNKNSLTFRLMQRFAVRPYVQIRIVRADGEVLLKTRGLQTVRHAGVALDEPFFLQAIAVGFNKQLPFQFPAADKNGITTTTFSVPLYSKTPSDSLFGFIFLDLDLKCVERIVKDMNTIIPANFVLLDGAAGIMADNMHSIEARASVLQPLAGMVAAPEPREQHAVARTLQHDLFLTVKPVKEYIAFREPIPQERWYIAVALSESPLHAAFQRTQLLFFFIFGVVLTIGTAGTFFIARRITQPIGHLTQVVQRFARGDLTANIPVESKDEIGMLTADFNTMADDLRRLLRERQTDETLLAVGRLSASLVHDLRNPIEGLKLLSAEMCKRIEPHRTEYEVADAIHQSVDRLSSLLTQSLNFARLTHPEFSPTNIVALADEALQDVRATGVEMRRTYDEHVPLIEVDAVQIKRVLLNILLNAAEACRNNPPESPGAVEILLRTEDAQIRIEIADNGQGILQEIREKIFEPFFSTKTEGHGLGLSFAKQILKNHGGELTCTSEMGKGTRFVAALPIIRK